MDAIFWVLVVVYCSIKYIILGHILFPINVEYIPLWPSGIYGAGKNLKTVLFSSLY